MSQSVIYLASTSPRRRTLLETLRLPFEQCAVDVDESVLAGESAEQLVTRLAAAKASQCRRRDSPTLGPILAADTVVVLDGNVMGKPTSRADGLQMLSRLSGRSHQVMTAVVVDTGAAQQQCLSISDVAFRDITAAEIAAYWATGEPVDKAGGYAIQGLGAIFVAALSGSFSGVMGLPIFETAALLRRAGMEVLPVSPETGS